MGLAREERELRRVTLDELIERLQEISERHPGPVHLLFTDVVMPALRGPALAARLRALRPEIALLYTSGYTDGTILSRDAIEPPGLFLQKPLTPAVIVRAVRDALDAASTRPIAVGDQSR